VGHVGLSPLRESVEVGYAIEEQRQGKGLASRAVVAMSEWGLRRFELTHILGIVAADNLASWRVLERAGYELVQEVEGDLHGRHGLIRTYQLGLQGLVSSADPEPNGARGFVVPNSRAVYVSGR
jgi:RimJ/RimL family protein N-acetyltransferase